jgi:enoyl-CoA hydratase/carnithine racemase
VPTVPTVPTEPTTVTRTRTEAGAEVAVLTFDHGPLNLFDQVMFDSLVARIAELAAKPPRALLLRAEGKVNSAGVDVHLFQGLTAQREPISGARSSPTSSVRSRPCRAPWCSRRTVLP